jgi:hypothetical protein
MTGMTMRMGMAMRMRVVVIVLNIVHVGHREKPLPAVRRQGL